MKKHLTTGAVRFRLLGAAGLVGLAGCLAACGGDSSEETSASASTGAAVSTASCADSFAAGAGDTLTGIVNLSHAEGAEIITGTYSGETFEAQTYDEQIDGDGTNVSVEPGACVVTEVSKDFGPLYLFVEAPDGWHRLLESDPKVPIVPDPESQLEDVELVQVEAIAG